LPNAFRRCSIATNPIIRKENQETEQPQQVPDARIGRSVSAEHRAILQGALARTSSRSFNELLISMPNVGEDSDFAPNRG
jgi:plasmid stability protein